MTKICRINVVNDVEINGLNAYKNYLELNVTLHVTVNKESGKTSTVTRNRQFTYTVMRK